MDTQWWEDILKAVVADTPLIGPGPIPSLESLPGGDLVVLSSPPRILIKC